MHTSGCRWHPGAQPDEVRTDALAADPFVPSQADCHAHECLMSCVRVEERRSRGHEL